MRALEPWTERPIRYNEARALLELLAANGAAAERPMLRLLERCCRGSCGVGWSVPYDCRSFRATCLEELGEHGGPATLEALIPLPVGNDLDGEVLRAMRRIRERLGVQPGRLSLAEGEEGALSVAPVAAHASEELGAVAAHAPEELGEECARRSPSLVADAPEGRR